MNIFVVDKSTKLLKSLIDYLSDIPDVYFSGIAFSIPDAIKGIEKVNPDIVIWGINVIGENSFKAIQTIKNQTRPPVLILYISLLENGHKGMYKKTGADYVIKKIDGPSKLSDLLKHIKKHHFIDL